MNMYNASEGFFAAQDLPDADGMLLFLDHGIFYEFIPMSDYKGIDSKNAVDLSGVEPGVNYALVISTNGGLWRYIVGDTIMFSSTKPYRFKITGRTKSYINTFGEELIVDNAEKAVSEACKKTGAQIRDFTACPMYITDINCGGHEWLFEFIVPPDDLKRFNNILDETLRQINSDYDAKRYQNMILKEPLVRILPNGTFDEWLKSKGKLGGQNKVPRLSNNREMVEEILRSLELKKMEL